MSRNSIRARGFARAFFAAPAFLAGLLASTIAAPLRADLDEQIGDAADRGIEFLLKAIEERQVDPSAYGPEAKPGKIALETYALVVAGVSVEHPLVKKNYETLSGMGLDRTYNVACYAFALDAAISQLQSDAALANPSQKMRDNSVGTAYRPRLEACINALVHMRWEKHGAFHYNKAANFDNSNTQFGVLGLGLARKYGIGIPPEVWEEIALHFIEGQQKNGPEVAERPEFYPEEEKEEGKRDRINIVDKKTGQKVDTNKKKAEKKKEEERESPTSPRPAPEKKSAGGPEKLDYFSRGWDYQNKGGATWNMTCAGLSSLILAEENLRGKMPAEFEQKLRKAIRDGYAWMMQNWVPLTNDQWHQYGLYSLEKVADLGEVKKFAGHDWFVEVAQHLIGQQRGDGSWPGANAGEVRCHSSFALLILNRATSLITQGRSTKGKRVGTGSGMRKDKEVSNERNWVYIPKYELEFHLPSLLRQARQRPSANLLKLLELAIESYPPELKGYLAWNLVDAKDGVRNKNVAAFLQKQLVGITGTTYESSDKYRLWYKRWVHVHEIGTEGKDADGYLKQIYPTTKKSVPLKIKVLWAIHRCQKQDLAPLVFEDLGNEDADVRHAAYETLSLLHLSKDPVPAFDAKAEEAVRQGQINQIRDWLQKAVKPAQG